MPTIELVIKGKVQGVFYRASVQKQAVALGLKGWVKNSPDGSVILRATGDEAALEKLQGWCAKGPSGAVVTGIEKTELPEESFADFRIVR